LNVSLPFESHNVAYQCKGIDQSNIVCEYEVKPLTIKYGGNKAEATILLNKILRFGKYCKIYHTHMDG